MPVATLKHLAYKKIDNPGFYKKLKSLGSCPYDLLEPVIKQMTVHQILVLEENTVRLIEHTQPVWKMHTLKTFPSIVDSYDIDDDENEDADWRLIFHELQEERREREQAAREKLRANYSQIATGKSDRKIQVIRKAAPSRGEVRASVARASSSTPSRGIAGIMGKAVKATVNSATRLPSKQTSSSSSSSVVMNSLRPSPTASTSGRTLSNQLSARSSLVAKKPLSAIGQTPRTSKFLSPISKRL